MTKRALTPDMVQGGETSSSLTVEALRGKALAMLSRREHSRAEMRRKLLEATVEEGTVERVLDELQERRLQSDERFAEIFVHSRLGRGYGPLVITRELKERGLSAEAVSVALDGCGCDWVIHASEVRRRRFGSPPPSDLKERARQYRFLQYRGFSGAQITAALEGNTLPED